jgi:predicted esterase
VLRQCAPAGDAEEGGACQSDTDCAAGLRCNIVGLGLACVPEGSGDIGESCAVAGDCYGGLTCLMEQCTVPPSGLPPFGAPWQGVDCDPPVEEGVKAYFEVPGAEGADEGDFFRLPFPSDVRRSGDTLDLSDFPTPGDGLLGIDPVQLYVDAIEDNDSAWGAYPTVIFRFSGPFDFDTFERDAVQFVDITDPENARGVGWGRFYTDARTNYICDNFLAVQPPFGRPLEPNHTYAVLILSEVGATTLLGRGDGEPVVASENMAAVLASAEPDDAKLAAAHAAFAPLRAYLTAESIPASNVLTASVLTVGDIQAPMSDLADAVADGPVPTASDWVRCDGVAPSPCPQADDDRACGDDVAGYDEYHALLSLTVYQQGTAPYLTAADGGGIDTNSAQVEEVCMSITVPEGAPPTEGWPAVVFAHGTGGSFRNHVRDEVAGVLAAAGPQFAVIGIDQVAHGPRRGDSMQHPNNLFFNFLNPAVTRGNPLQGAADQLAVARFAGALDVPASETTGEDIRLDATRLFFLGHSQGATEGSLMLPFGDAYKAAVLSGNGASLRDALRTKTQPENIAGALPLVLQDPLMSHPDLGPGVTINHPVLSLLQQWIDPADPLNFAAATGTPLMNHTAKHVFQTFGIEDTYSPPVTMATYAVAGGLTHVEPHSSADPAYTEDLPATVPVGYSAATGGFTRGFRQYGAPSGSDGHFVLFDVQQANDDMVLFLTGAAGTTPPVIGD